MSILTQIEKKEKILCSSWFQERVHEFSKNHPTWSEVPAVCVGVGASAGVAYTVYYEHV